MNMIYRRLNCPGVYWLFFATRDGSVKWYAQVLRDVSITVVKKLNFSAVFIVI